MGSLGAPASRLSSPSRFSVEPLERRVLLSAIKTIEGFNSNDNGTLNGGIFEPPDPNGAVGPDHIVNVVNVGIEWFTKDGTREQHESLADFYAPLAPVNGAILSDPHVLYDTFDDRFVIVMIEVDLSTAATSRILMAVSNDTDPNLGWSFSAINAKTTINGTASWIDYPTLGIGPDALFIGGNMFPFGAGGMTGTRLWVVPKDPFYSGGAATSTVFDPAATVSVGDQISTLQPANLLSDPTPRSKTMS